MQLSHARIVFLFSHGFLYIGQNPKMIPFSSLFVPERSYCCIFTSHFRKERGYVCEIYLIQTNGIQLILTGQDTYPTYILSPSLPVISASACRARRFDLVKIECTTEANPRCTSLSSVGEPDHWMIAICALYFLQNHLSLMQGNYGYRRHVGVGTS